MKPLLLVLAPHGRDTQVICRVLHQAGLAAEGCQDLQDLLQRIDSAAGVMLTEEALYGATLPPLLDWVARQPPWSDLPFVVLVTRQPPVQSGRRAAMLEALGNAVLLERPLNGESLASAGRAAVRARRRQLTMRTLTDTLETRVAKRTEELMQTEAQFRAVFESFPESLFVLRVGPGDVFTVERRNSAAEGSGLAYVIGQAAPLHGRLAADASPTGLAARLVTALRHCVETGSPVLLSEDVPVQGGMAVYDLTMVPLRGDDGRVARILGIARDVTARNQLEQRLRQAQKLEAVGQLTGGVAHDFNNLLQVIISGLTLMERIEEPARREQVANSVRRAAQRGGDLTKRLLTVARRQALRPMAVDLQRWLNDGAGELLDRALRGDIVVIRQLPPDLPPVQADPGELELALLNLAVNARDAMPNGGTLIITAETQRLDGSAEADGLSGEFVRLAVTDTGTGMSKETQARVFEPFFTTKDVGKGTGLGLAQVYGFVRQSGGGARLRSAPGEGTTISLLLPVAASIPAAAAPARAAPDRSPRASAALLVVEDDEDVAGVVLDMLHQLGHRPERVTTASAALKLLAGNPGFDLVFSDVMMPGGMDGLALAREFRRLYPAMQVILTTGYTGGGLSQVPLGIPVLQKPYRLDDLAKALDAGLARVGEAAQ